MSEGFEVHGYIAAVRWQCAKTMPQWPHEYMFKAWREDSPGMDRRCRSMPGQLTRRVGRGWSGGLNDGLLRLSRH